MVRVSGHTLELFESLGRGEAKAYVFPSPRGKGHLTRQAIGDVCRKWGRAAGFHVHRALADLFIAELIHTVRDHTNVYIKIIQAKILGSL